MTTRPRSLAAVCLLSAATLLPACALLPDLGESSAALQQPAPTAAPAAAPAAPSKQAAGKYLSANAVDVRALLPDPPAVGSPVARGEIDLVLAMQADASPEAKARALAEDKMTPWLFSDVLGAAFNPDDLPLTAALLNQATTDCKAISDQAKTIWSRPRPSDQDPRITVRTEKPGNLSYPSGHATRGVMWSRVLSQLAPDKTEALAARARLIGSDRIVAGVHYATDVAAGFALGNAVADRLLENPVFQRDLEAARAEWKARSASGRTQNPAPAPQTTGAAGAK